MVLCRIGITGLRGRPLNLSNSSLQRSRIRFILSCVIRILVRFITRLVPLRHLCGDPCIVESIDIILRSVQWGVGNIIFGLQR